VNRVLLGGEPARVRAGVGGGLRRILLRRNQTAGRRIRVRRVTGFLGLLAGQPARQPFTLPLLVGRSSVVRSRGEAILARQRGLLRVLRPLLLRGAVLQVGDALVLERRPGV
jgi:hypothetical protein